MTGNGSHHLRWQPPGLFQLYLGLRSVMFPLYILCISVCMYVYNTEWASLSIQVCLPANRYTDIIKPPCENSSCFVDPSKQGLLSGDQGRRREGQRLKDTQWYEERWRRAWMGLKADRMCSRDCTVKSINEWKEATVGENIRDCANGEMDRRLGVGREESLWGAINVSLPNLSVGTFV